MQILLNHVVLAEITAADVAEAVEASAPAPATLPSALGLNLDFAAVGADVVITPEGTTTQARLVATDVETCVGTVHVVDMVLVPSSEGALAPGTRSSICHPTNSQLILHCYA